MAIGYTPTTWVDNDTLVDAARLNNIETGVQAACDELDEFYDSSTKEMNAPGSVNIQELNSNINIGSSSVWIGLAAYISFLRLHSQNDAEYTVGDINDALSNALSLINYGGDIIIQNADNAAYAHGDIRLLTDGQALYNGVEIATKAKVGASSTDLNTLTSEGMYQIQNPNNAPSGVTGWVTLSVIPTSNDSTYCRQMLYIPSSDDIYTRNNAGGTWGSWNKLATKSDLTNIKVTTETYTGTTTSAGIVVTNIPHTNNIIGSYCSVAGVGNAYTQLRPSYSNYVVALCSDENGALAEKGVTIYVYKIVTP